MHCIEDASLRVIEPWAQILVILLEFGTLEAGDVNITIEYVNLSTIDRAAVKFIAVDTLEYQRQSGVLPWGVGRWTCGDGCIVWREVVLVQKAVLLLINLDLSSEILKFAFNAIGLSSLEGLARYAICGKAWQLFLATRTAGYWVCIAFHLPLFAAVARLARPGST